MHYCDDPNIKLPNGIHCLYGEVKNRWYKISPDKLVPNDVNTAGFVAPLPEIPGTIRYFQVPNMDLFARLNAVVVKLVADTKALAEDNQAMRAELAAYRQMIDNTVAEQTEFINTTLTTQNAHIDDMLNRTAAMEQIVAANDASVTHMEAQLDRAEASLDFIEETKLQLDGVQAMLEDINNKYGNIQVWYEGTEQNLADTEAIKQETDEIRQHVEQLEDGALASYDGATLAYTGAVEAYQSAHEAAEVAKYYAGEEPNNN